jgi:hypothetical protein
MEAFLQLKRVLPNGLSLRFSVAFMHRAIRHTFLELSRHSTNQEVTAIVNALHNANENLKHTCIPVAHDKGVRSQWQSLRPFQ